MFGIQTWLQDKKLQNIEESHRYKLVFGHNIFEKIPTFSYHKRGKKSDNLHALLIPRRTQGKGTLPAFEIAILEVF